MGRKDIIIVDQEIFEFIVDEFSRSSWNYISNVLVTGKGSSTSRDNKNYEADCFVQKMSLAFWFQYGAVTFFFP